MDEYYANLFGTKPSRDHALNLEVLHLPTQDLAHLVAPFSADELIKVLKSMPPDKVSGPDGFTGHFFVVCWAIIKDDFLRALDHFHKEGMRGLATISKALVTLLPKMDVGEELKDYRPVSLVHGSIKIFDKILAFLQRSSQDWLEFTRARSFAVVPCTTISCWYNALLGVCMP